MVAQKNQSGVASAIPILKRVGLRDLFLRRGTRLDLFMNVYRKAGDVGAFQAGARLFVLVNSAPLAYQALVENADAFEKSPALRVFSRPLLGDGLLTCSNESHRQRRPRVAPAFQPRRVACYAGTMAAHAERIQQSWWPGTTVDITREMSRVAFGIDGKTLFDAEVTDEAQSLGRELIVTMRHAFKQMDSPVPIPFHWPTPTNIRTRRAIARLNAVVYRMIDERRASGVDQGDFLSMLMEAPGNDEGRAASDTWIRDEAMTIFLAGHETTANALTWAWYLLTQHPEEYARLREEARNVLQGRTPTLDDLPRLPFALQVFKEALRLYPPAYAIGRQAIQDTRLGDYDVPAGSVLIICPYVMHRRADYFPEPEAFRPDRFAGEAEKRMPRCSYLPFSVGPRNCIGAHFALMEGQIVLAALAQRLEFELIPGQSIRPEPLFTLRSAGPIRMRVRRDSRATSGDADLRPALNGR